MSKKKILLLSDDLRMHSGIATQSKEFVMGTLDKYDWVQLGGAVTHPEQGKVIDMSQAVKTEYGIDDATYEHILKVIRHEIATFETTPVTYQNLGEEDLRNILIAHLNGHYEGDATGETFRHQGKTDIRIEADNRAAFVGECKVWTGGAGLSSAIDQLIGYLTWRDCKASLIVFNKKVKDFSSILEKCPEQLRTHKSFKREEKENVSANEWRVCLRSPVDQGREITVHVFLANLFVN